MHAPVNEKQLILFVDDEPQVLQGLKRLLRPYRDQWDTEYAESGAAALTMLSQRKYDVVVSDMRMPGMSGDALLEQVRDKYPDTVRLILSGQSEDEGRLRAIGPAHQYLSKPCDHRQLKATIERATCLRRLLRSPRLRAKLGGIDRLPSLPSSVNQLMEELHSPGVSLESVGRIVATDVSMTAKVLQLVNSAFFGFAHRVSDPQEAVRLIGLKNLHPLVLSAGAFSQLERLSIRELDFDEFIRHSTEVATLSKSIAEDLTNDSSMIEDAFLAGLLHDIGKLILAAHAPELWLQAVKLASDRQEPLWKVERELFDVSHAEVGAYLLALWGIPDSVVEAVSFHHEPMRFIKFDSIPLLSVHLANGFIREPCVGECTLYCADIEQELLDITGTRELVKKWERRLSESVDLQDEVKPLQSSK